MENLKTLQHSILPPHLGIVMTFGGYEDGNSGDEVDAPLNNFDDYGDPMVCGVLFFTGPTFPSARIMERKEESRLLRRLPFQGMSPSNSAKNTFGAALIVYKPKIQVFITTSVSSTCLRPHRRFSKKNVS